MTRTPSQETPVAGLARRTFLQQSLALVGTGTIASCFHSLLSKASAGHVTSTPGYGPLRPMKDEATGLELLQLPEGFRYVSYNWTGDPVEGGFTAPSTHDGMGVIASDATSVTLCRNHELETWDKPFGTPAICYDAKAGGGCTNLQFDTVEGKWLRAWPALSGTVRNCAGGPTPWGTWLSCEETVLGPGDLSDGKDLQLGKEHGWVFEVGAQGGSPVPLKAMGRFSHEAVAIDPATGVVYETEDRKTAGFYRFIPAVPGSLAAGGKLQMLKATSAEDLRRGSAVGQTYDVAWVDIDEPERAHAPGTGDTLGVFSQGKAKGGTTFARLEGCWYGNGHVYINATSGGAAELGQVWQYDPRTETIKLIFESPSVFVLDSPDNIVVSPRGGLILCEDGKSIPQHLRGLTPDGRIFTFAANNIVLSGERNGLAGDFRKEEWCGATFSPDGRWLFVNIQTPGITFAITGPWGEGLA
ncbi:MAG: alkaline phosphatase PhoX [Hyphomicrobium sp.]